MVTGQKAFEGTSQASLIGAILKDEPRTISTLQPMSPPMLDQVVRICFAKDPDERWQNAGDIGRQMTLATDRSAVSGQANLGAALPQRTPDSNRVSPGMLAALLAVAISYTVAPKAKMSVR